MVRSNARVLSQLLLLATGHEERANGILAEALARALLAEVPDEAGMLMAFVELHVLPIVRMQSGETLAEALGEDLRVALGHGGEDPDTTKPPPPPDGARPTTNAPRGTPLPRVTLEMAAVQTDDAPQTAGRTILLVDTNSITRTPLARELIRARCDVTVRDSFAGLDPGASFDAVITDVDGVEVEELVERLIGADPPLTCAVVAWTRSASRASALLRAAGLESFLVLGKDATASEILAAVERQIGRLRGV